MIFMQKKKTPISTDQVRKNPFRQSTVTARSEAIVDPAEIRAILKEAGIKLPGNKPVTIRASVKDKEAIVMALRQGKYVLTETSRLLIIEPQI